MEYLKSRYKEVGSIMFTLFSQEEATAFHEQEIREEAKAEGLAKGRAEGLAEAAKNLMESMSLSLGEAIDALRVPSDMRDAVTRLVQGEEA